MKAAMRNGNAAQALASARSVQEDLPWQKTACQLEIELLRHAGDREGARDVLIECLGYFPTKMLR